MVVDIEAGRKTLVSPSSGEFPRIAYLPSVEKVSVFVHYLSVWILLVNKVPT